MMHATASNVEESSSQSRGTAFNGGSNGSSAALSSPSTSPNRTKRHGTGIPPTLYNLYMIVGVIVVITIWISNFRHMHQITTVHSTSRTFLQQRASAKSASASQEESPGGSPPKHQFHIVFSTGCNAFQDWQSYVLFHQVWKSGQTGNVTRVASDCKTDEAADELRTVFARQIQSIPTGKHRFQLHITPDFSKTVLPGLDYKFFNKPHGLRHWMEQGLGWPQTLPQYKDVIFIILDPDQFILRPFTTTDFGMDPTSRWKVPQANSIKGGPQKEAASIQNITTLQAGQPISQMYGYGSRFMDRLNRNITHIVSSLMAAEQAKLQSSSHLYQWTAAEMDTHYTAGPPYMAVASDMYQIVNTWATVVAPVYQLTTDHLSEMFAYSTAAAHLDLKHSLGYNFMISEPFTQLEGWEMIDSLEPNEVCLYSTSDTSDPKNVAWRNKLPHIVHYCQRYFLGPYFFNKYKLPHSFLSCEHGLVLDPTLEANNGTVIALKYDSAVTPNNEFNKLRPAEAKRHAFFLCHMIGRLNEAATYWKQQHCSAETANYKREYTVPFDPKK